MFCPKCGASVTDDAAYCPKCGYQLAGHTETNNSETKSEASTSADAAEVAKDVKSGNLFKRVFAILFSPSREWEKISKEKPRVPMMIFGYLLVLSLVAFTCIFIGSLLNLFRNPWVSFDMLFSIYFIKVSIFSFIKMLALIGSPIIAALIINSLTPSFKTEKNFGRVMQLTTYSFTPVLVAWTLYIIPFPFIDYLMQLISLYGIIILLLGFKKILTIPENKQVGFYFTMVGILYGVYYMIYWTIKFIQVPVFNIGYNYYAY